MTGQNPGFKKLEKRLEGEPILAGEYTLQPVAQVAGWHMAASGETGEGAGALLRITPLKVIVSKGQDEPNTIALTNENEAALKGILQGGIVVAALCSLGIIVAKILSLYKEMKK